MKKLLSAGLVLAVVAGLFFGGLAIWAKTAAANIELESLEAKGPTMVLASDGKSIGQIASAEAGKSLSDKQVSTLIRQAHMAAEDRAFYTHGAISLTGMGLAMLRNAQQGTLAAGGSTITQQLAKDYAGTDKTIGRKINELPYAYRLEEDFTKDQLLTKYVNSNYYGRGAYGIEDAAQTWFGVSAKNDLTDMKNPRAVARAAFLASLIKSPSEYDNYRGKPSNLTNADTVWGRTRYVLDGLREIKGASGLVSKETVEAAKKELPLKLTNREKATGRAVQGDPSVMQYVQEWLREWQTELARQDGAKEDEARKQGQAATETLLARGGLKIQTDLDRRAQTRVVSAHKKELKGNKSGVVIMNPRTGGIAAMSGSRNPKVDAYNYAVYTQRPPGSTMKPFVLADAVKQNVSVKSVFAAPGRIKIDGPAITDHGGKDAAGCKMTLADSLAVSHNVVAVEMLTGRMARCGSNKLSDIDGYPVKVESVATLMHKAGADASLVPGRDAKVDIKEEPRLAIGSTLNLSPLKLAVMASTLANGGEYHKPYLVRNIITPDGKKVFEHEEESDRVIDEEKAAIVNQVLTGVFTRGTARNAQVPGYALAGKTGTTDEDQGDAWGFAYNPVNPNKKYKKAPTYVCSVWAGGDAKRYGADTMEVCQNFFQGVLDGTPAVPFPDADMDAGKMVGLNVPADPPPPPPTEEPEPEPTETEPSPEPSETVPSEDPSTEPTETKPTKEPKPTTKPTRTIPPPVEEADNGGGPVAVPGIP